MIIWKPDMLWKRAAGGHAFNIARTKREVSKVGDAPSICPYIYLVTHPLSNWRQEKKAADRLEHKLGFVEEYSLQKSNQLMAAENPNSTVYVGNLDERVSDRVLYDILIQAGRLVDLYIPRDKETDKPKGFAFAQYETEEIADYAVKLFSGLVTLYKRTLKFAISGQDKPSTNSPMVSSSHKLRPHPVAHNEMGVSPSSVRLSTPCRFQEHQVNYSQVRDTPGVSVHQPNGYRSNYDNNSEHSNGYRSHYNSNNYDYSRRVFGGALDTINRSRFGRYDTRDSTSYYTSY